MFLVALQLVVLATTLLFSDPSTDGADESEPPIIRHTSVESLDQIAASSATGAKPRHPRVLLITAKDSAHSASEVARLTQPDGELAKLKASGWKIGLGPENHLQIVSSESVPQLVAQLNVREFPTVACIDHGEVVRSFKDGCTTPLDVWTFGWLAKGIDERPPGSVPEAARVETTGHYPLRGNHWSVDGDWSPSRETVIGHLRGGNHGWQLSAAWEIDIWSYEELRALHDHLHEKYGGGISASSRSKSSRNQISAARKAAS